ncbi:MAG TPA: hypothetical protein VMW87_11015, partial [Spirochaetia bacterium]|nr:hypothetical protein [Spirochaetia bacterium]
PELGEDSPPLLLWTNGHFSMGGTEVLSWPTNGETTTALFRWEWNRPLQIRYVHARDFPGEAAGPLAYTEVTVPALAGLCSKQL